MSYLLSSGCSHSIGWEIEEEIGLDLYKDGHIPKVEKSIYEYRYDKTFPYLISKHLNLDYVNIGFEGNSNEKIIYDIIDYIATYYILTMDFKSLSKLCEKEYCDKLVVLTSDIIKATSFII